MAVRNTLISLKVGGATAMERARVNQKEKMLTRAAEERRIAEETVAEVGTCMHMTSRASAGQWGGVSYTS